MWTGLQSLDVLGKNLFPTLSWRLEAACLCLEPARVSLRGCSVHISDSPLLLTRACGGGPGPSARCRIASPPQGQDVAFLGRHTIPPAISPSPVCLAAPNPFTSLAVCPLVHYFSICLSIHLSFCLSSPTYPSIRSHASICSMRQNTKGEGSEDHGGCGEDTGWHTPIQTLPGSVFLLLSSF